jgi:hypothetical protein
LPTSQQTEGALGKELISRKSRVEKKEEDGDGREAQPNE